MKAPSASESSAVGVNTMTVNVSLLQCEKPIGY